MAFFQEFAMFSCALRGAGSRTRRCAIFWSTTRSMGSTCPWTHPSDLQASAPALCAGMTVGALACAKACLHVRHCAAKRPPAAQAYMSWSAPAELRPSFPFQLLAANSTTTGTDDGTRKLCSCGAWPGAGLAARCILYSGAESSGLDAKRRQMSSRQRCRNPPAGGQASARGARNTCHG